MFLGNTYERSYIEDCLFKNTHAISLYHQWQLHTLQQLLSTNSVKVLQQKTVADTIKVLRSVRITDLLATDQDKQVQKLRHCMNTKNSQNFFKLCQTQLPAIEDGFARINKP